MISSRSAGGLLGSRFRSFVSAETLSRGRCVRRDPDIFPRTFPLPDNFPPFRHGVGHSPFHHHHPLMYRTRSVVIVYKIDNSRSVKVRSRG